MNTIGQIAQLMTEQIPAPGMTSTMSGAANAQSAMNMLPGEAMPPTAVIDLDDTEECDQSDFAPEHVKAAKDLIAMVGSADRARELIDKVDDALEVFDDNGENDAKTIDLVASLIPDAPDMPMQKSFTRISSMFDPSAGAPMH